MTPADQTLFRERGETGNCMQACLATILGLPLHEVPHFALFGRNWTNAFTDWCDAKGLDWSGDTPENRPKELCIAMGTSPRDPKGQHAVVYHHGRMVFDPHPSRAGLVDVTSYLHVWKPESRR